MTQKEQELYEAGWHLYRTFPRWKIFWRRNADEYHHYWHCLGMDFLTLFKNGRTAKGYINP